jgi:hypothetical protein
MPHLYQTKIYVLNLCFWGEAHASPFLKKSQFVLKLVVRHETRASPYQTKFYILKLYLWGYSYVFKMMYV